MSKFHPWAKGQKHNKLAPQNPYWYGYNTRTEKQGGAEEFQALYAAMPKQVRVNKRTEKCAIDYAESGDVKDFAKLPRKARQLVRKWEADACDDTSHYGL